MLHCFSSFLSLMSLMLKNAKEKTFIYYPWFILQQNTDVTVIQIQIKLESNELEKFISSSVGNVQCESVRRIQRPGRYYHVPHKSPAFPPGCLDITETQLRAPKAPTRGLRQSVFCCVFYGP